MGGGDGDAVVANDDVDGGVEGFQLFHFDANEDIPVVSSARQTWQTLNDAIFDGGADRAELTSIAGGVADLGLNVIIYAADPLNFLLAAGLGFLIDVVQPLQDALGLVTGNPERMDTEIAKWERVGNALGPLADEIRAAVHDGLLGWHGKDAEAARARLNLFADGVASLTEDVNQLKLVMDVIKTLMDVAQQLVISVIATFVEYLMWTWIPAMAAAVPTAGASTAAAAAATEVEASVTTTRLTLFLQRVARLLMRLRTLLFRMHPRLMRRGMVAFQLRAEGGHFGTFGKFNVPLGRLMEDWRTWAPPGRQLLAGGISDAGDGGITGSSMSDEDQDRALSSD